MARTPVAPPAPVPPVTVPAKPDDKSASTAPDATTKPATKPSVKSATRPVVTIETAKGKIVIELYPEEAPATVESFVSLTKKGFYNGLTFHRVEPGFVIQGGDPLGDGRGGPGYAIKNETNRTLTHRVGAVAMANAGRDTAGSQFYIVITKPAPNLDGKYPDGVNKYTIFGQVISGQDVAEKTAVGDRMTKVTVVEPPAGDLPKITRIATPRIMVPVIIPYLDKPMVPKSTTPRVRVSIDATGKSSKVELRSKTGVPELDKAVTDAVNKWLWLPAMKDGVAIPGERTFTYDIVNRSVRYE